MEQFKRIQCILLENIKGKIWLKTKTYHLYIISDDDIKEDDWFIHFSHGTTTLLKCKSVNLKEIIDNEGKNCWLEYSHKILLTTDQDLIKDGVQAIGDEFLEWFVKNPNCEEVEVKDVYKTFLEGDKRSVSNFRNRYKIIIPKEEPTNPNNQEVMFHKEHQEYFYEDIVNGKLTTVWLGKNYIPKEEPKQETFEEAGKFFVENTMKHSFNSMDTKTQANRMLKCVEFGAKWQQERSYSEEDLISLLEFNYKKETNQLGTLRKDYSQKIVRKWFEEFKKK